jgi:hypothetical protein
MPVRICTIITDSIRVKAGNHSILIPTLRDNSVCFGRSMRLRKEKEPLSGLREEKGGDAKA